MSKYTQELGELLREGIDVFPLNIAELFYTDDKQILDDFILAYLEHYYFSEIGSETVERYIQRLGARLRLKKEYWRKLYATELATHGIEFLLNKDLTETYEKTYENDLSGEEKNTGTVSNSDESTKSYTNQKIQNIDESETETGNNRTTTSETVETDESTKESNLSDGLASSELIEGSLTNVKGSEVSGETNGTNTETIDQSKTTRGTNRDNIEGQDDFSKLETTTNDLSKTNTEKEKGTEITKLTSKGNIGTTSSATLLKEWRNVLISMNELIIEDCADLFMIIY